MNSMGKIELFASINDDSSKFTALNAALNIPPLDKRQPDLQYITSIFVSTGMNLNGAYFLPSELYAARDSIISKPLDVEHDEERVVGHLFSHAFVDDAYSVVDVGKKLEKADASSFIDFNIATGMYLYKARFADIAEEVLDGKYGVSMECYYQDFDIILGDSIVPRLEAEKIGLIDKIGKLVKVVNKGLDVGTFKVGRVIKGMLFSGCGLVEHPANVASRIIETAAIDNYVVDLSKIEGASEVLGYKNNKKYFYTPSDVKEGTKEEQASVYASNGGIHVHSVGLGKDHTFADGAHAHMVWKDELPAGVAVYFIADGDHSHQFDASTGIFGEEKEHTHKVMLVTNNSETTYLETSPPKKAHSHGVGDVFSDVIGGDVNDTLSVRGDAPAESSSFGSGWLRTVASGDHVHTLKLNDGTEVSTVTMKDVIKYLSTKETATVEVAGEARTDANTCVNYRKYIYEEGEDVNTGPPNADPTPGMVPQVDSIPIPSVNSAGDSDITPRSNLLHEDWCTLFDTECTTEARVASHPDCLRNILNSTTKEAISSYMDKLAYNRTSDAVKNLMSLIETAKHIVKEG